MDRLFYEIQFYALVNIGMEIHNVKYRRLGTMDEEICWEQAQHVIETFPADSRY